MFLSLFFSLSLKIVRSNRMPSTWQPATLPLSYSSSAKSFFFFCCFLLWKFSYIYAIYIDRINLLPPPTCATYLIYPSVSWLKISVSSPVSLIIAIHVCVDMGHPLGHEQAAYQWPFSQKKTLKSLSRRKDLRGTSPFMLEFWWAGKTTSIVSWCVQLPHHVQR